MPVKIERNIGKQVSNLELLARNIVEGFVTGIHKSPYHGFSVEFTEYKPFNYGDSVKHIDWKLYAKTDKLMLKHYEQETNLRCQLILDISSSMFFPLDQDSNKLTYSSKALACILYLLKKQRDAVGLTLFSDTVNLNIPPKTTLYHYNYIFEMLEKILNQKERCNIPTRNISGILNETAGRLHKNSMVALFSDMMWLEDSTDKSYSVMDALKFFRYKKHEVILFYVFDSRLEKLFEYENRPYKFVDIETGESINLQPYEVKQYLSEASNQRYQKLKEICRKYNVYLVELDIRKDLVRVLQYFLGGRKRLLKKAK